MTDSAPRTAIVTGAARGLGRAIAIKLAKDGYDVTVADLPSMKSHSEEVAAKIEKLGRKANVADCDVSVKAEVDKLVADHVEALGPLFTMVANAGISQGKGALDITEQDMKRIFEVNVYGVVYCYQAAAKQLIAQGTPGRLLGCSSITGQRPLEYASHYSASKFAVRGYTQSFAMELAPHNIKVNAYCPGFMDTEIWAEVDEQAFKLTGQPKGGTVKRLAEERALLKRSGTPEDVANVVSFLASDAAEYMTGQSIIVDGGVILT